MPDLQANARDTRRPSPTPTGIATSIGTFAGGAVWGLGLAQVLALELHSAFFLGVAGALASALLCALAAILLLRYARPRNTVAFGLPLLLPALNWFGALQSWRGPVLLLAGLAFSLYSLVTERRSHSIWVYAGIAVLLPLAVYLPDISPFVGRADTFEFQVVAPRLGIAHPSGYPLYILVGKLFSWLPMGSPARRINLSSAVFAALAAGTLFMALRTATVRRSETESRAAGADFVALIAALTLAFSPTLWSRAIEAEVYALNAFIVGAGLWLAVRWATGDIAPQKALPALALLTGVGMASHITLGALVFLALPLAAGIKPRPAPRVWLTGAALGLAGLALYLYIPLRWPAVTGTWMSPAQFMRFVTNADSGGALRPLAFWHDPARWGVVGERFVQQIGWPGVILALTGLARLWWKRPHLALGSTLAFGAWTWFNLSFYVADPDYSAFLIPAHILLIFWMGYGMQTLLAWGTAFAENRPTLHPAITAGLVLCALLPASRLWITGPGLDTRSQGQADEAWGRYALRQDIAPGAAILADSEKFPPLYYLQQVEGLRPDLEMVTLFSEEQYRADMEARLTAGQRVYLARYLPGLDAFGVSSVGPLVEVSPSTIALTSTASPEGTPLSLADYHLEADPEGRAMHHLILTWYTKENPAADLGIQVRLRDASGAPVWSKPAARPVGGYSSTQAWQAGQTVRDYHALAWPDWLPEGDYTLEVGVVPRFATTNVATPDQQWFTLQTLSIGQRTPSRQSERALGERALGERALGERALGERALGERASSAYFVAPGLWLTGVDLPGEALAASEVNVDSMWGRMHAPVNGQAVFRWVAEGAPAGEAEEIAGNALTPGSHQAPARRDTIPAPEQPGIYRLEIGWRNEKGLSQARCGWLASAKSFCPLGTLNVGPANQGLANFGNRILLLDAHFDGEALAAGGQATLDLTWRALRTMEQDYTVFVQLLGPDGALYGQVDSWPMQGTRPTGGWTAGEEINDVYQFYRKDNAPPGKYRVIVGWYLLADMSRLPTLDGEGNATGDFYTVAVLEMP